VKGNLVTLLVREYGRMVGLNTRSMYQVKLLSPEKMNVPVHFSESTATQGYPLLSAGKQNILEV
jgi:hypothetical protein